jgi:hypothetical protein
MARPASGLFENQKLKYFWTHRMRHRNVHGGQTHDLPAAEQSLKNSRVVWNFFIVFWE